MEEIYKLIRDESVVLFCGAGLSIKAGYPSGEKLAELLYLNLSDDEKIHINQHLPLPDMVEQIVNLKNRKEVLDQIKSVFASITPIESSHRLIKMVPHLKTIVTTNYDTLVENAYAEDCVIVRNQKDILKLDKNKTEIFKIHGDFNDLESIVITRSDYTRFFDMQKNELMWTFVKERLASKNVLFVGYSVDDTNIESIITQIKNQLGEERKKIFLLAPNLRLPKTKWLEKQEIVYLDGYAEPFFEGLLANIKENIISDFDQGKVSPETFRKFLTMHKLLPYLEAEKDKFTVRSVKGIDNKVEGKFGLKFHVSQVELSEKLSKLINGDFIGELEIEQGEHVKTHFQLNGITIPSEEGNKFVIRMPPLFETLVDLCFEDGYEVNKLKVSFYKKGDDLRIIVGINHSIFTVDAGKSVLATFPRIDAKFNFEQGDNFSNVSDEIVLFNLLRRLACGSKFTVFSNNKAFMESALTEDRDLAKHAEKHLDYFEKLKRVEQVYNIRFTALTRSSFTNKTYFLLLMIIDAIEGVATEYVWQDQLSFRITERTPEVIELIKGVNPEGSPVTNHNSEKTIVELHGHKIDLGYQFIEYLNPYVVNLEEVLNGDNDEIIIKSKSDSMRISHLKSLPENK